MTLSLRKAIILPLWPSAITRPKKARTAMRANVGKRMSLDCEEWGVKKREGMTKPTGRVGMGRHIKTQSWGFDVGISNGVTL